MVNTQQSDWVARGRGCRLFDISRNWLIMCLVALALKRKCISVCLVDKAPLVLAGKFSCVLAGMFLRVLGALVYTQRI